MYWQLSYISCWRELFIHFLAIISQDDGYVENLGIFKNT